MSTSNNGIIKARPNAFNLIDPSAIQRREGWNPRFDFGEIEELAKSILANDVLIPLRVKRLKDGQFELIDGDRRLTAIEYLIKNKKKDFAEGVPAILEASATTDLENLIKMFESNSNKPFLPLEEAAAYKRMRDVGMTLEQIAARVSRNHVHVVDTLRLLEAAPEVQDAVRSKKIGATTAKHIAKAAKGKQAELVGKAIAAPKGSRTKIKKEIEASRVNKRASTKAKVVPLDHEELVALEKELSIAFVTESRELGMLPAAVGPWVSGSDELVLAAKYGVLLGLRHALGQKVNFK